MISNDNIATVRNLRKVYDTLTAVDGISFEIKRGEIFGLLGPNGAGKTTTISMLAGILPPTGGEIVVDGHDASQAGTAVKRAIGVVPQELAVYPKLTGKENLDFFGELYGIRKSDLTQRTSQMLELVGLSDRAGSRAETYSGGMKRRLNLAIGLMHNPRLLLLDEPTVGVDPQSRNHIFEGVRALNQQGLTILYTSHYMEEVEALCDRVGIMDGGKLVACDTVPNLIAGLGGAVIEIGVDSLVPTEEQMNQLRSMRYAESVDFVPAVLLETETVDPLVIGGANLLRIRARQLDQALPELIAALYEVKISLRSFNIQQPNLETVFLALTGKSLRD
ncbi:MAG: ABC-type multidrug transport system, ATPase component [Chthonomonadaceae bacterium]|nr:ABC-type multidrug transport system, ATPase component [Chthonomonadaceae bacterium]